MNANATAQRNFRRKMAKVKAGEFDNMFPGPLSVKDGHGRVFLVVAKSLMGDYFKLTRTIQHETGRAYTKTLVITGNVLRTRYIAVSP